MGNGDHRTFTNTPGTTTPQDIKVDIKKIVNKKKEVEKQMLKVFEGVPLHVDHNLTGNQWAVVVSPDLYEMIQKK